jgi:PAS domain S-box-containing protein
MAPTEDAPPTSAAGDSPLEPVRAEAARRLQAVSAVVALLAVPLAMVLPRELPPGQRSGLIAICLAYAGLALLAMRVRRSWTGPVTGLLGALSVFVIAAVIWFSGLGIDSPAFGLMGLQVLLMVAIAPRTHAWPVIVLAIVAPAVVAWADWQGLRGSDRPPLPVDRLWLHLLHQWMVIAAGIAGGLIMVRLVVRHVLAADERERRFRGLLAVAADAYWEIDAQYRLTAMTGPKPHDDAPRHAVEAALGRLPWELPQLLFDADTLDLLQASLDARTRFRDLAAQWVTVGGDVVHVVLSGEPRLDPRGVFLGYWGVASNVSADVKAREALAATESRYQDLFEHMPTALLLHRGGRIVDANPAAQALLVHDGGQSMSGMDLLSFFEPGDSRERARRRLEDIETMPIGVALPVADYRLRGRTGRQLAVRGTGVRVDAPGGPATLSIFVDDTERRVAEDAVRRSETMLSHLVATSPDVITLTDLATGRYVMVNQTFERMTGFGAHEVVGQTSLELGVWAEPEQRAALLARIEREGSVKDMPVAFLARDGRRLEMQVSGARFMMDRRDYMVINARDVSARERERLERAAILHTASIGIALTRDQRFVLANPCLERLCGWPEGSLAGEPGRVVWGSDEEYDKVGAMLGPRLSRGEVVEFENPIHRRDGSSFLARLTVNPIDPLRPRDGGTVWIIEDVTGPRQAEAALARARDEAEAANRAKSAFLANTSHELRTPLNGMIGLARLAREPNLEEARRRQYLDQIGDSAQSLAAIISDILDLSKIESGSMVLETAAFDLDALLRTLHLGYTMLADAHDLTLALEMEPGAGGHVLGDALRVRQILSNFLSNALKFTEHGGIRLRVARIDAQKLRFEVHDTGMGIDDPTMARLFRPFTQADESTTRRFGGTGLGLSICRELATLMNGQVGADSAPGQGSCFWAELPLPATEAPVQVHPDEMPEVRGARVLMVEDNAVNMLIAVAMLEQWGVGVEQASDGLQAIEAVNRAHAQGQPFDAVLMDVQMPHMSGYEATRALRRLPGCENLPVIALTAAALVTERDEALSAGMNDFLTKPIDSDRLRATLARWVSWRAVLKH